jgi:hypothetical protein
VINLHSSTAFNNPALTSPASTSGSTAKGAGSVSNPPLETLLGKLADNIPGMSSDGLKALDPAEFTPEKVAERISGFVAAGLDAARQRGASDERLNQLYQAAVSGVEKGFAEAREILDNLNLLQGAVAEQVDATERATADALAAIAPGQAEASAATSTRMGIVERFSNAEEMELRVRTRDGDEVVISFSRDQAQQSAFAAATDGDGTLAAQFSLSRSERSEYSFSVRGELDTDEIDALQNLIKDVSSLADEFFDGDVQKAFEQSANLRFDSSELQSMKLDMSYSRQYVSAASYEQVQGLEQAADRPGKRLGQMMKSMAETFGAPSLGFLSAPGQLGRDLFEGLVQQDTRYRSVFDELQRQYDDNLARLLDAVIPAAGAESAVTAESTEPSGE